MTSISSIALSGMNAAQTRLNASAHNVANLNTEGFVRQEVSQTEQPNGGVNTQLGRASAPGESLVTDMVGQLQAKNMFLANLAVFKTHDRMAGALFSDKA